MPTPPPTLSSDMIMSLGTPSSMSAKAGDLTAGVIVFLVALPLCLGIALASGAPMFAGLLAGVIGGIIVGILSGSHTSVSGPAAGLTAVVAARIEALGSYEAFLLALLVGGLIQIALGLLRAGFLAAFVPSGVIKGLLAAIGVILILKQLPHLLGHDTDPEGEMAFAQPDHENTVSELGTLLAGEIHPGAMTIGLISIAVLLLWDRIKWIKQSLVPAPLVVVLLGIALSQVFRGWGGAWAIEASHLVQVPIAEKFADFASFFRFPDFRQWLNPAIYVSGMLLAIVASLETLLNLEAVDKLDPLRRNSPPSRELWAQGIGNVVSSILGGLPVTSVVVRSSVNINAGGRTKWSAVFHGILLAVCVACFPRYLNLIPLSCLAAILLVTGIKLASPRLVKDMWSQGRYQFLPFAATLVSIVLTDLLVGILIGLAVSLAFILNSNLRRPLRQVVEKHLSGEVVHIELPDQVSFLNRAVLERRLDEATAGTHLLLDASRSDYIDPDILALIREFKETTAPLRGISVSLRGFRDKYHLRDETLFVDYSTRELQGSMTPLQVLETLQAGHQRFRSGHRLTRDLGRQMGKSAEGQHPLAIVLSCIDSRTSTELIFDLGLGDIFSVRIAGNVCGPKVLGSLEFGCAVAGAKLILVLGHTKCGAVTAAVELLTAGKEPLESTGCEHLEAIVGRIQPSVAAILSESRDAESGVKPGDFVERVTRENVIRTVAQIASHSQTIRQLVAEGKVAIVGGVYDVGTGGMEFLLSEAVGLKTDEAAPSVVA